MAPLGKLLARRYRYRERKLAGLESDERLPAEDVILMGVDEMMVPCRKKGARRTDKLWVPTVGWSYGRTMLNGRTTLPGLNMVLSSFRSARACHGSQTQQRPEASGHRTQAVPQRARRIWVSLRVWSLRRRRHPAGDELGLGDVRGFGLRQGGEGTSQGRNRYGHRWKGGPTPEQN